MNITGSYWFRATINGTLFADGNQDGVFSSQVKSGVSSYLFPKLDNGSSTTLYFDASKNWTGETSAVGGGKGHTHGIKMTVK